MSAQAIDLARLPAPQSIEALDAASLAAAWQGEFARIYPDHNAVLASDPAIKLLEAGAYREMLTRARINDGTRAVMLPLAGGADLDNLAANFGVARQIVTEADPEADPPREAVMEDDESLRRRALSALDGVTTAGSRASYLHHALSAHSDVIDAYIASPAPSEISVTVLARFGADTGPVLSAVQTALNGEHIRPLGDRVTVIAGAYREVDIRAALRIAPGPDAVLVMGAARQAVEALNNNSRPLGRGLAISALHAALHQPGIIAVRLEAPAGDIAAQPNEAVRISAVTLSDALSDDGGSDD